MVFGGVPKERIQFNVDSLWVGDEQDTGRYQAFGDLFLTLEGAESKPEEYTRELDIENSIHRVEYKQNGVSFKREYFASHPAETLVFRWTADQPGAYTGKISLTDTHSAKITVEDDQNRCGGFVGKGKADQNQKRKALRFVSRLRG